GPAREPAAATAARAREGGRRDRLPRPGARPRLHRLLGPRLRALRLRLPADHVGRGAPRLRAVPHRQDATLEVTSASRPTLVRMERERCLRCSAEMEWRHGTWQCARCRFKLGCCEGEPQTCAPDYSAASPG